MYHEAFGEYSVLLPGIFFNWDSFQARPKSHDKVWKYKKKEKKKRCKAHRKDVQMNICQTDTYRKDLS